MIRAATVVMSWAGIAALLACALGGAFGQQPSDALFAAGLTALVAGVAAGSYVRRFDDRWTRSMDGVCRTTFFFRELGLQPPRSNATGFHPALLRSHGTRR